MKKWFLNNLLGVSIIAVFAMLAFPMYLRVAENSDLKLGAPDVEKLNDCPYIFYIKDKIILKWIDDGTLIERTYNSDDFQKLKIASCEDFESKYLNVKPVSTNNYQQNFKEVSRIAILSDIHGQYDLLIKLLQANHIIDEDKNWIFKDGHFVIVGDVFDRGDKVTEALWFLYKLEQQAAQSGGKLHLLLGNHEIMVLDGDLRYVNDKYLLVSEKMELTYDELFASNTVLGQWLRSKPVAISINDIAFAHAGFSPEFISKNMNIETVNRLFHQNIIDISKDIIENDGLLQFLKGSNGPIWYRGYFQDESFSKQNAQEILDFMGMKNIVVGHTTNDQVLTHYDGLIYSVDSNIKGGLNGEILFWEANEFYRGTLTGTIQTLSN